MSTVVFLDSYEPLDVIGNGSFGIIRKVRRKADGLLFARKELNFERMSERDRKQIVSEVNILKELNHDHIVRYHDRYVDRDAGILYILMEYCGGGDLSTVIKQASKQNRPIAEDTIWNYFYQILSALQHCHHPNSQTNGHMRSGSGSGGSVEEGSSRRVQILHRDLKPDNVFLDENNTVKLGDFGLSKALAQASFASTYVGTPYYMSPELMQEKAYDSKSDIWSLGCLMYELCALKPPFHEAKTHAELSIFIRNGRIPPLPRGYSHALTSVIKSMLNLNPAMRPSALQILQHERLEIIKKLQEAEKLLANVKYHKTVSVAKEREIALREANLRESEEHLTAVLNHKDQEIASLQQLVSQLQQSQQYSHQDIEHAIKQAVARREEELRVLVMKREEEVALAIAKREEEIMEAVRAREAEVDQACVKREEMIKKEVDERIQWVLERENELRQEETRIAEAKADLETNIKKMEQTLAKGRKEKNPLEEVKNLLEPLSRVSQVTPAQSRRRKQEAQAQPTPRPNNTAHPQNTALETPIMRPSYADFMPSAMKGVVLTSTGETLATPTPAELVNLFKRSPKVGLNFGKIFDFEEGDSIIAKPAKTQQQAEEEELESPPPSPSLRKEKEKEKEVPPPTRIRRPSIRTSSRSAPARSSVFPACSFEAAGLAPNSASATSSSSSSHNQPKPLPHPHLRPSSSNSNLAAAARANALPIPVPRNHPSPEYDFADEENLPSPFLKRIDKSAATKAAAAAAASAASSSVSASVASSSSAGRIKRRGSSGLLLRAVAAANNAGRWGTSTSTLTSPEPDADTITSSSSLTFPSSESNDMARPSLASARKASEEARKALLRA